MRAPGKRSVISGRLNWSARLDDGFQLPIENWIYHLGKNPFRAGKRPPDASVLSRQFVHKFDAIHAGFPTVAAVCDRRFFLQHAIKPAVIDRRYNGQMVPKTSANF